MPVPITHQPLPGSVTALDLANLAATLTAPDFRSHNGPDAIESAAELYRQADAYLAAPAQAKNNEVSRDKRRRSLR